ncbi:hypothetical protein K7X08_026320 [Anisodus acutangulus]|uniref:Uncharacterized protein n=1 Tax=Anisodus acutangulus TaxID=402998 RepID=A0A9Q1LLM2_9SOLA|nr:hypothetical protein K7X08_026320 [Anisodus acutangulus]
MNQLQQGTLPVGANVNPKEQCLKQIMAVSLRNGRDLDAEEESAQSSRDMVPPVKVPIELDESDNLAETPTGPQGQPRPREKIVQIREGASKPPSTKKRKVTEVQGKGKAKKTVESESDADSSDDDDRPVWKSKFISE